MTDGLQIRQATFGRICEDGDKILAELSSKERSELKEVLKNIEKQLHRLDPIIKERSQVLHSALTERMVRAPECVPLYGLTYDVCVLWR